MAILYYSKRMANGCVSKKLVKSVQKRMTGGVTLSQEMIKSVCDTFVKTVIHKVEKGNNITLTNHLTFKRVLRKARKHRNPKTGAVIMKPEHYAIAVKVKPALKQQFNNISTVMTPCMEGDLNGELSLPDQEDGSAHS
jgi:nucleoid DNA-binding protein